MATRDEIAAFIRDQFPQARCRVDEVSPMGATVSQEIGVGELRPGGTVSGPVLMAVADLALYVAILGELGIVPLAVTTSFNINFLRKPAADRRVIGVCKLLKLGRTLAIGEVGLSPRARRLRWRTPRARTRSPRLASSWARSRGARLTMCGHSSGNDGRRPGV